MGRNESFAPLSPVRQLLGTWAPQSTGVGWANPSWKLRWGNPWTHCEVRARVQQSPECYRLVFWQFAKLSRAAPFHLFTQERLDGFNLFTLTVLAPKVGWLGWLSTSPLPSRCHIHTQVGQLPQKRVGSARACGWIVEQLTTTLLNGQKGL